MTRHRIHRVDSIHPRQGDRNADEGQAIRPDHHLESVARSRQGEHALVIIAFLIAGSMIAGLTALFVPVMAASARVFHDRGIGWVRAMCMVETTPEHRVYGHR